MGKRTLISFDWAIKRLLRQKANYEILEGFLSELLHQEIVVKSILESEGNQEDENDKYNMVDLFCEDGAGHLIIIEVQFYEDSDFFHRMLYSSSKVITERMALKSPYSEVRKVYSVNIIYFDLGQGHDYLYRGKNEFKGIYKEDLLNLSERQKKKFEKETPSEIFPEYYLIKVNNFDDIAKNTLDEWIYFLKNTALPENYSAKGLDKVEAKLKYDNMDTDAKIQYDHYLKHIRVSKDMLETAMEKGKLEGRKEMILRLFDIGIDIRQISQAANMSEDEIKNFLQENGREISS